MATSVDYYFSVASPWTYLGSERFIAMVRQHRVNVRVLPLDYTRVFAATGGLLYDMRAAPRRAYRQVELARWRDRLGIALQLEPRFYPVDRRPASYLLIAARELGQDAALRLSHIILRTIWCDDGNIADWDTLVVLADQAGLDGRSLVDAAQDPAVARHYLRDTDSAIAAQVFGAPSYVVDGEIFWGQDRLDFLAQKLEANSSNIAL